MPDDDSGTIIVLYPPLEDDNYSDTDSLNIELANLNCNSCETATRRTSMNRTFHIISQSQRLRSNFKALEKRMQIRSSQSISSSSAAMVTESHDDVALAKETLELAALEIERMERACAELEYCLFVRDGEGRCDLSNSANIHSTVTPLPLPRTH